MAIMHRHRHVGLGWLRGPAVNVCLALNRTILAVTHPGMSEAWPSCSQGNTSTLSDIERFLGIRYDKCDPLRVPRYVNPHKWSYTSARSGVLVPRRLLPSCDRTNMSDVRAADGIASWFCEGLECISHKWHDVEVEYHLLSHALVCAFPSGQPHHKI
ncbi:hypothetical protein K491DRAFT_36196 [Lophiostoma macrostomum CBS 122681]|uniref:Uncharacterized protein n=1 Tax=Lophiostoma macrostomum CBS 122681 TaxID=1314788 RepID=A0A6A6T0J0_9PLEO|nr:hypothetical protein K491DRAFT_36196 [Lophiostoma macrostomum CBS 122681]